MKVLLTGGSGNLGHTLVPKLLDKGDAPVIMDIRAPRHLKKRAVFIEGSILERPKLTEIFRGCDCIVHIAAWHGIHEDRGEKNAYEFFDLNVRGTFEVSRRPPPPASTRSSSFRRPAFIGRIPGTAAARFWPN
jgi:nucleoside-diphosphate-sugar epimerase